ncbi:TonB-dependent receptor [Brevundimonas aurifodinae]|uniref:TonB-dependent receptor n=2 Tax=Brevundimonas TaxID=41275 RepID=A0ABV1NII9_9CAUL|nr:MAG: TonB-dependent receptor [Brevundimonas sp. 12-68-7]OYX35785.1 MAG: TonB-dependent receptor [Brevundimonas subvibrioides]
MTRVMKSVLLAGAAWSAASTMVMAQDVAPAQEQATALDEIVVTARRRDEQLKDVPIAVSALSSERLEQTGAADITALQQQTPNATVQVARGSNSTLISFIRGIGQQDPLWGFEPGVGLYIDDVYVARPQGAVLDIFDVERIEVLRGPQGTLYGRNTIGGAIKYVTRRLGNEPDFIARGTLGSYNQRDFMIAGDVPLSDQLSIGGAFASYDRDGYGENLNTGEDQYDRDVTAFRASAEWTPSDRLFFRLAHDRVEDDSNPRHGHREVNSTTGGFTPPASVYDTNAGIQGEQNVVTEGTSFTAEYVVNDLLTLKSISAWRSGDTATVIDFDQSPLPTLDVPAIYADEQFTQEFQAILNGDRWSGVAGLYWLDGESSGVFDTIAGNLGVAIAAAGYVNTESFSAYADFSFDFTDRLSASVGGRYTRDDKDAGVQRFFYLGATRTPLTGGTARPILQTRTNYTAEDSFEQFTPRVSVSYDLTEELTGYASIGQGFKSGGWDMRGDAFLVPQTVNGYDPETVTAYELGLKGTAFDRRLSFASAVFYSDYEDLQITTQQTATPPATGIASVVDNVGQATIYGFELEGSVLLTDSLTSNFSIGYLKNEFDEFITLVTGTPVDISNVRSPQNSPEWSGYWGVTWAGQLAGGELTITPSLSYRSEFSLFDAPDPVLDQGAYTLVDLSAIWSAPNGRYQVGVFGRNLTDEEYRIGGYNFAGATFNNSISAFYGPPRTWSAQLTFRY